MSALANKLMITEPDIQTPANSSDQRSQNAGLKVIVQTIREVAEGIREFTLVSADGRALPAFSGGSHIVVSMPSGTRIYRNAYSLLSPPEQRDHYRIAVRLQENSRGGSRFMHQEVKVGMALEVAWPLNLFALSRLARKQVLVAGGIGITPFMSQVQELLRQSQANKSAVSQAAVSQILPPDFELHYAYRSQDHAAYVPELQALLGDRLKCYDQSQGVTLDIRQLLADQPLGTHVYTCGPEGMVQALLQSADELGWPPAHVHHEEFLAPPVGSPFTIKLASSQQEVQVGADQSMLEALEQAGVDAPYLCRGGACGRCELEVLSTDGTLEHHDHYLSAEEKRAGRKIMPCVSRARCDVIELNF